MRTRADCEPHINRRQTKNQNLLVNEHLREWNPEVYCLLSPLLHATVATDKHEIQRRTKQKIVLHILVLEWFLFHMEYAVFLAII
jgi:hypothetical protein